VYAQAVPRAIYASALDSAGAPVPDLTPADFVVREDKIAREILAVAPAADPMELVVLVDNSQAAEPFIGDLRQALPAFFSDIAADERAKHRVALVTLADRPTVNTDYTLDLAEVSKGVGRIFAQSGSATYFMDGIIETSQGLAKRSSTRPVILAIITEGVDLSGRSYQRVLDRLKESGAALHVVIVGQPVNNDVDRNQVITVGPRDSGGRTDNIFTSTALTTKLKQVAADLTHQYKVTYARPQSLIPPEQVTITAAKPGLTVRGTPAREVVTRP
jgi:hypothetical protein